MMMSDPMVLTQCLDIDLEFDTPASSQPFRPITVDAEDGRESSETFCLLRKSATSALAHPVDDAQTQRMPLG